MTSVLQFRTASGGDDVALRPDSPSADRLERVDDEAGRPTESSSLDLLAICAIALLGVAAAWIEAPILVRSLTGVPLVLFCPGYALVSALFPFKAGLGGVERIGLGFGLSMALVAPQAMVISYSPWGIRKESILMSLLITTFSLATVAFGRRTVAAPENRFAMKWHVPQFSSPSSWSGSQRLSAIAATLVLCVFGAAVITVAWSVTHPAPSTDFALLNDRGEAKFYQRNLELGQPNQLQLQIVNNERKQVTYRVDVSGGGAIIGEPLAVEVDSGESWTGPIQFRSTAIGEDVPIHFELRRVGEETTLDPPYRELTLIVQSVANSDAHMNSVASAGSAFAHFSASDAPARLLSLT